MDVSQSLFSVGCDSALWQFFEDYDPPVEEFSRLVERFEQLSAEATPSSQHIQQIDDQIGRILYRLNQEPPL